MMKISLVWLQIWPCQDVVMLGTSKTQCCTTLAEASKGSASAGAIVTRDHTGRRSGACRKNGVAAEHCDAGTVFGTTKRDHVLANMAANELAEVGAAVGQDILDEIVSELIASNYSLVSNMNSETAKRFTHCQSEASVDDLHDLHRSGRGTAQGIQGRQS